MHIINLIKKKNISCSSFILKTIITWLILNLINSFRFGFDYDLAFAQSTNIFYSISLFILIFSLLWIVDTIINKEKFDFYLLLTLSLICPCLWVVNMENDSKIWFICTIFLFYLLLYKFNSKIFKFNNNKETKIVKIIILICATIMCLVISITGVLRYLNFWAPNFDLGIPGQNFYYLKKLGIPYSTCERQILLNHLLIHFSPIYYLLLPLYIIFPHVTTLQVASGILIASALIPIYLICKNHKLSNLVIIFICIIYTIYTPAICGTFYDFHENIFLPPLLLWLFYFYEKKKNIPFFIMLLLVLFVKEDAAIYIFFFSIYSIFDGRSKLGIVSLVFSIIYFIGATTFLTKYGEGAMFDRYSNLEYESQGIINIFKTFLINPGYIFAQLTNAENIINKVKYILQLLLPLGFIPLLCKKYKNYLLLLPLLVTLATTYQYSFDITFHYSFGIISFLIYLFIINIDENKFNNYLVICLFCSILCFSAFVYPQLKGGINNYILDHEKNENMESILKQIPQDASVIADTFLLPHLTNRDILYETYYVEVENKNIDYVIFDDRFDDYLEFYNSYINLGYKEYKRYDGEIIILKNK